MIFIQSAQARAWLFLTFSSICAALLYGPFLGAPLVFDDIAFFSSNYASKYGIGFAGTVPRGWTYWTFAVQRILLGEENLLHFRLANLVLHVLTVNALFLFLRQLFSALLPDRADTKAIEPDQSMPWRLSRHWFFCCTRSPCMELLTLLSAVPSWPRYSAF